MSALGEVHAAAVKAEQEQLDREAIEHLDWDHEPICQAYFAVPGAGRRVPCDRPAQWRMFCRGCGQLAVVCGPCRGRFLTDLHPRVCNICRQYVLVLVGWAFEPLVQS